MLLLALLYPSVMNPLHGVERVWCWRALPLWLWIHYMELKESKEGVGSKFEGVGIHYMELKVVVPWQTWYCPRSGIHYMELKANKLDEAKTLVAAILITESITWSWKGYSVAGGWFRAGVESITWSWKNIHSRYALALSMYLNPLHGVERSIHPCRTSIIKSSNPLHGVERTFTHMFL